jgi:transcriptional regulator with XRE-family HTH domain
MTTAAGARTIHVVSASKKEPASGRASDQVETEGDGSTEGFGARLAEAMASRGLSGGELGRRTGFTSQYVNSLQKGDRGARLPHDTAKRLAHALGVSVDWLTKGEGPRERLSDVYPAHVPRVRAPYPSDIYPSRGEAIALLSTVAPPEVIAALREVVPETDGDPGRDFWIDYAKELTRAFRRIKDDPDFGGDGTSGDRAPRSSYAIKTVKKK